MPLTRTLSYAHLRNLHPEHDPAYWQQLRALLAGGRRLLGDLDVLKAVFPPHNAEDKDVYEQRRARAFYIPYPAEIVGDLVGMLDQDPLVLRGDPDPDPFYTTVLSDNVDRKGLTLTAYAQAMVREALTACCAWALVDLPPREDAPEATVLSLGDEEAAGMLRAWVTSLPAEAVPDWEEDDDGELLWACVKHASRRRMTPDADRATCLEVFTFYDREGWARFEVRSDEKHPPKDADEYGVVAAGSHTFGKVPLVRLRVPEGLWAMDKLHGIARAHFNLRSALGYAEQRNLFPLLTAFLGPEMGGGDGIPSEAQQHPERATGQKYGVGRVQVFGKDDRLEYVAPPADVYTFAGADLDKLRDEMHRVCAMMAASIDNTPAAVGRSGESKRQDKSDRELVLQHLGMLARNHVRTVLEMIAAGRRDPPVTWGITGFRHFDQVSAAEAVQEAQLVEGLTIPSATFWRLYRTALAKRIVGHDATPDDLEDIAKEIETNTADEEFAPPRPAGLPPPGPLPPNGQLLAGGPPRPLAAPVVPGKTPPGPPQA